jgi:hypothetical protein
MNNGSVEEARTSVLWFAYYTILQNINGMYNEIKMYAGGWATH